MKNVLTISLPALLIFLIILEVILRTVYSPISLEELTGIVPTPDPMSEWAMNDPYAAFTGIPGEFAPDKTINSHGFISTPEIKKEKDSSVLRIVILGESSTAGTGYILKDQETWPWILSGILNDSLDQKVEVINAAMGAYTSFESYGRLWSRIRFFDSDVVIVNHGWNEMYYFNDEMANNPTGAKKPGWTVNQPIKVRTIEPNVLDGALSWSQIYSRLRSMTGTPVNNGEVAEPKELLNSFNPIGLEIWRENLRLIKEFCLNRNIKLLVFKQPTLITKSTKPEDQKRCKISNHGFDYDAHVVAYEAIYKVVDDEIEFVIAGTSISGKGSYFYDHVHPTPEGSEAIANLAAQKLLTILE